MLAFELVGMALVMLFFGAMISTEPRGADR